MSVSQNQRLPQTKHHLVTPHVNRQPLLTEPPDALKMEPLCPFMKIFNLTSQLGLLNYLKTILLLR